MKRQDQVSIKRACLRHSQGVVLRVRTVLLLQGVGQLPGEAVKWGLRWTERLLQSDERQIRIKPGLSRGACCFENAIPLYYERPSHLRLFPVRIEGQEQKPRVSGS